MHIKKKFIKKESSGEEERDKKTEKTEEEVGRRKVGAGVPEKEATWKEGGWAYHDPSRASWAIVSSLEKKKQRGQVGEKKKK